uniref:Uncharacterized protein n=1 Tax=Rhizophora mucronata TaxID=61149 RepID=A0A2P2Q1D5_RHIMU
MVVLLMNRQRKGRY